jgi:hypothetical protein
MLYVFAVISSCYAYLRFHKHENGEAFRAVRAHNDSDIAVIFFTFPLLGAGL